MNRHQHNVNSYFFFSGSLHTHSLQHQTKQPLKSSKNIVSSFFFSFYLLLKFIVLCKFMILETLLEKSVVFVFFFFISIPTNEIHFTFDIPWFYIFGILLWLISFWLTLLQPSEKNINLRDRFLRWWMDIKYL